MVSSPVDALAPKIASVAPWASPRSVETSPDTPLCVNPKHLSLGAASDNARDKALRGRVMTPSGDRHWGAKMSMSQVRELRRRYGEVEPMRSLASRFGISRAQVARILHGKDWKDPDYVPQVRPRGGRKRSK